ncbi:MAG TPA: response regulator, partial [Dehalococcoidia bacterium]|nr:response regulator [Dehalococcoidia bacterium]
MTAPAGAHVLVVDDEPAILRAVSTLLTGQGYRVETAETAGEVLDSRAYRRSDLILLDLGLPDADGFEVIRAVREHSGTPIIVLSVRGAEADKVRALTLGADDYLTKPFGVDELLARVHVALRHAAHPPRGADATFRTGNLSVDLAHRRVSVGGDEVHLTPTEYELLKALITHANKLLTEEMLLRQVWGPEYGSEG